MTNNFWNLLHHSSNCNADVIFIPKTFEMLYLEPAINKCFRKKPHISLEINPFINIFQNLSPQLPNSHMAEKLFVEPLIL